MEYKFTINGRLDDMNKYTTANRSSPYLGSKMKADNELIVMWNIRKQLKGVHICKMIHINYMFIEKNKKRDKDNVASFGMKVIQDSLVKCGIIDNDGWNNIDSFACGFQVDKDNPRIIVHITEI